MRSFSHFFLLALVLGRVPAWSSPDALPARASSNTLTLSAAFQRTTELSPDLRARRYDERAAEALIEQAGLRPNPTLEVSVENVLGTGATRGLDRLEGTLQASQTIERGGKRERRIELAQNEHHVALLQTRSQRADLLAATALAYLEVVAAERAVEQARELLTLASETQSAVEARVRGAMGSAADLARSRSARALAQAELAQTEAAAASARAALAATWGGSFSPEEAVQRLSGIPEAVPSLENRLLALPQNPRLTQQQAAIDSRRATLKLEQAQVTQDLSVGGGVRFFREGSDAAFVAGVSVPLPLRHKNQGAIRAARESLAGAESTLLAIETALRISIEAAWRDLAQAHQTAQSLQRDALPPSEEAYSLVRDAYEQGRVPFFEVLDAQRELLALKRSIRDQEIAYARAQIRLDALTDSAFTATLQMLVSP
ncbi:MAG TPA: TolC family protein [Opitutaceae bacterium]|nr:TolC family protein [Opitutaceae bacterium]